MRKKRVVQVGLMCLLLTVSVLVTGCIGGSSTTKAEVNAVLDRLQSGMYYENIGDVLLCYTDPFYYIRKDGTQGWISLADYHYELSSFFEKADYQIYSLFNRKLIRSGLSDATIICDWRARAYHINKGWLEDYCQLEFTMVKVSGYWNIRRIVEVTIVQGSQKLSVLGLPREPEQAKGLQE